MSIKTQPWTSKYVSKVVKGSKFFRQFAAVLWPFYCVWLFTKSTKLKKLKKKKKKKRKNRKK